MRNRWLFLRGICTASFVCVAASSFAQTEEPPADEPAVAECFLVDPNLAPEDAVALCTQVVTAPPSHDLLADALYNRGIALRELGKFDASAADLERSQALRPDPGTQRMLAWTYRALGRLDEADALYTSVLAVDDTLQGRLSRCVVRQDLGQYEAAAKDCDLARAQAPDNLDALYFSTRVYNYLSDGKTALELARRLVALDPGNPRNDAEFVWALHFTGQTRRALARARVVLSKNPENTEMLQFIEAVSP